MKGGASKSGRLSDQKTERHIQRVLDGIAVVSEWGKNIPIVSDDSPGRIIVEQYASNRETFRRFVLATDAADAGAAAATREFLGVHLGRVVSALLERGDDDLRAAAWAPDSVTWSEAPKRGRFSAMRASPEGCAQSQFQPG